MFMSGFETVSIGCPDHTCSALPFYFWLPPQTLATTKKDSGSETCPDYM